MSPTHLLFGSGDLLDELNRNEVAHLQEVLDLRLVRCYLLVVLFVYGELVGADWLHDNILSISHIIVVEIIPSTMTQRSLIP